MNIAKILELQDLYIEANKISKEFEDSEINKKYQRVKDNRTAAKNLIQDILRQADDYQQALVALSKQVEDLAEEAKEIADSDYDGIETEELDDEKATIDNCRKEVQNLIAKTDGTKAALQSLFRKVSQVAGEYKKFDAERNALRPQFEDMSLQTKQKFDVINEKIKALKEAMSDSDVALYEQTKAAVGKTRVVVKLTATNCGGCGMELDPAAYQKIIEDKYGKCPNCNRLVYVQE